MEHQGATPPALRWVSIFLVVCAVLGLWLGFQDQIRRHPPSWYSSHRPTEVPAAVGDEGGVLEAAPLAPEALTPAVAPAAPAAPAPPAPKLVEPSGPTAAPEVGHRSPEPPLSRAKPTMAAIKPETPRDPVGDILESQKVPDPPPAVPY